MNGATDAMVRAQAAAQQGQPGQARISVAEAQAQIDAWGHLAERTGAVEMEYGAGVVTFAKSIRALGERLGLDEKQMQAGLMMCVADYATRQRDKSDRVPISGYAKGFAKGVRKIAVDMVTRNFRLWPE